MIASAGLRLPASAPPCRPRGLPWGGLPGSISTPNRVACPWLIRRFTDPDAEILYVPGEDALEAATRGGALSFAAPGARCANRGGLCTFEVRIRQNGLTDDAALARMARVVRGADIAEDRDATPESPGFDAIARGVMTLSLTDHDQLRFELPVSDALDAWAQEQVSGA